MTVQLCPGREKVVATKKKKIAECYCLGDCAKEDTHFVFAKNTTTKKTAFTMHCERDKGV